MKRQLAYLLAFLMLATNPAIASTPVINQQSQTSTLKKNLHVTGNLQVDGSGGGGGGLNPINNNSVLGNTTGAPAVPSGQFITDPMFGANKLAAPHGGTGITLPAANQVLGVNAGATAYEGKDVLPGTGISVAPGANSITISNTGVTSLVQGSNITLSGTTGTVTISSSGGGGATSVTDGSTPLPLNLLPKYQQAVSRVLDPVFDNVANIGPAGAFSNTGQGQMLLWGDSTVNAGGTYLNKPMITAMNTSYNTVEGIMFLPGGFSNSDPRVTYGSYANATTGGWGGNHMECASGGSDLTFSPGYTFDTINIYWGQTNSSSSWGVATVNVDGGSALGTLDAGAGTPAFAIKKTTYTLTAPGVHTLHVTAPASHTFPIFGIECFNSFVPSMRVTNGGVDGTDYLQFTTATNTGWEGINMIDLIQPDAVFLNLVKNDSNSSSGIQTHLQPLITKIQLYGDCILNTPFPTYTSGSLDTGNDQKALGVKALGVTNSCGVVDLFQRYSAGTGLQAFNDNWYANTVHFNQLGYADNAAANVMAISNVRRPTAPRFVNDFGGNGCHGIMHNPTITQMRSINATSARYDASGSVPSGTIYNCQTTFALQSPATLTIGAGLPGGTAPFLTTLNYPGAGPAGGQIAHTAQYGGGGGGFMGAGGMGGGTGLAQAAGGMGANAYVAGMAPSSGAAGISNGTTSAGTGGAAGGTFKVLAVGDINIASGTTLANNGGTGTTAGSGSGGGGGGSGGATELYSQTSTTVNGTLQANGGNGNTGGGSGGDDGGGGGGGLNLRYSPLNTGSGTPQQSGGATTGVGGATNGGSASALTINDFPTLPVIAHIDRNRPLIMAFAYAMGFKQNETIMNGRQFTGLLAAFDQKKGDEFERTCFEDLFGEQMDGSGKLTLIKTTADDDELKNAA